MIVRIRQDIVDKIVEDHLGLII